jgi:NAD(P)-dependent dehydrogenase (short-subunit alcohol dehydrogenase family)
MNPLPVSSIFDFSGKTVLVTGSSRGIGAGIAMRFAEAGADLVVHCHSNLHGAQEAAKAIQNRGQKAVLVGSDLTHEEGVTALIHTALETYGKMDVLINNAGTYPVHALIEMSLADWRAVIDANLTATFLCTQLAARQMKNQAGGGAIINISSIEAQNPAPLHAHYAAAKAAVEQFSRTAANELAQYGIRVNLVSPGLIWRDQLDHDWPDGVQRWLDKVPLKRLGQPEDVADACLFLASEAARWITGANLTVDGGMLTVQQY